jgi:hypothetical protein
MFSFHKLCDLFKDNEKRLDLLVEFQVFLQIMVKNYFFFETKQEQNLIACNWMDTTKAFLVSEDDAGANHVG